MTEKPRIGASRRSWRPVHPNGTLSACNAALCRPDALRSQRPITSGMPHMALFTALSPYFDVNSINDYNRYGHLKPVYTTLYKATNKPLMITEFSFSGFPSPGQPSDLFVEVYSQANRGIGYHKYTLQAAQAPFMVGMHWFMWSDYAQAASIGSDPYPPDVNVGLVTFDEATVHEELG